MQSYEVISEEKYFLYHQSACEFKAFILDV